MSAPTAAVVIIGAEVLSAKVTDANGPFLLGALRKRGIETREVRTIGDDVAVIARHVRELAATHTYVITTGGVGPTHDDVTMEGIARAFDAPVVRDATLVSLITAYYAERLRPPHLKMAEVPEGAEVRIPAGVGLGPPLRLPISGEAAKNSAVGTGDAPALLVPVVRMRNVYVLPGVPTLVQHCWASFEDELARDQFFSRELWFKVPESVIADTLTAAQKAHPQVAIGSYPRVDEGPPLVKVTFDGRDEPSVDAAARMVRDGADSAWLTERPPSAGGRQTSEA